MKLRKTNILKSIIFITFHLIKVKCNDFEDDYLKDTVRAELFTMTDYKVPDIYINMSEEDLEELFDQGSEGLRIGDKIINDVLFGPPEVGLGPSRNNPNDISALDLSDNTERFKVTNATLKFILDDEEKFIDSVNVSVGGKSSLISKKLGYNIKCNKGNLYGRKNIRIRPTVIDASLLRCKLTSDILNRLGIPSISANYARVFFNDKYMGFYVLMDVYKKSWIKKVFPEDKEVRSLYQCNNSNAILNKNNLKLCTNANEEYEGEMELLEELITTITNAKTSKDLEDVIEVDEFIKVCLFQWLVGTWDSFLLRGRNYYLYQQLNGKWLILPYDFDSTFGYRINSFLGVDKAEEIPFEKWYNYFPIVDILIKNDQTAFINNLQYILDNAFNPDLLFPHIDSLKAWLTPYIEEDHTPINGTYPGYVNKKLHLDQKPFSMEEFYGNIESMEVNYGPGIKKWIQDRYNFVCSYYPVTCQSSVNTKLEQEQKPVSISSNSNEIPSITQVNLEKNRNSSK